MARCCPFLILAGLLLAPAAIGAAADEELLRSAGQASDGPALLDFFRRRALSEVDRARVADLIRQLGDDDFETRERASRELIAVGPLARGMLREAARDRDLERATRARQCLQRIEKGASPAVVAAAARLLARRKPSGATAVLLDALPGVEDEGTTAVVAALAVVGFHDSRPEAALLAALRDKAAARRAGAAEVLCRAGGAAERRAVRKLLDDRDLVVRRRATLALLEARDKTALPVLIDMVPQLTAGEAESVEEVLLLVAGESAPKETLAGGAAARRKWRDAWQGWWKKHGERLDLAKVDWAGRLLGYTLIVERTRVYELDAAGKVRWQINGRMTDARVVGPDRVLVCEAGSVSERTFKNEVIWRQTLPRGAISASRQRDGRTLVVARNMLYELDWEGKEVWSLRLAKFAVGACRLPGGEFVVATRSGEFIRMDRTGKVLKSFSLGRRAFHPYSTLQVLPGGRLLVPLYYQNKVVEFDADGKVVWEAPAVRPTGAQRLPNGHILLTSLYLKVAEIDRTGHEVKTFKDVSQPIRAWRR